MPNSITPSLSDRVTFLVEASKFKRSLANTSPRDFAPTSDFSRKVPIASAKTPVSCAESVKANLIFLILCSNSFTCLVLSPLKAVRKSLAKKPKNPPSLRACSCFSKRFKLFTRRVRLLSAKSVPALIVSLISSVVSPKSVCKLLNAGLL